MPPPPDPLSLESHDRLEMGATHAAFAESQQAYITTYIQLADTKCAWAFAVAAALVAFMLTNEDTSPLLSGPTGSLSRCLAVASTVLLILSSCAAFLGTAPRLFSSRSRNPFSFVTVASFSSAKAFRKALAVQDESSLTEARVEHNYDIAVVCARKYRRVRECFWLGGAGVALLGLALLSAPPAEATGGIRMAPAVETASP